MNDKLAPESIPSEALSGLSAVLERINACRSLQDFADLAPRLLGNPMLLMDSRGRTLARSELEVENRQYESMLQVSGGLRPASELRSEQRSLDDLWNSTGVVQQKIQGVSCLCRVLRAGTRVLGRIDIPMVIRPFIHTDQLMLELLANSLVPFVAERRMDAESPNTEPGHTLFRLLAGSSVSLRELKNTEATYLRGNHCLLCINATDASPMRMDALEKLGGFILNYASHTLVLFSERGFEYDEDWCDELRAVLKPLWLRCGMSSTFTTLGDLRPAYHEARAALEIGLRCFPEADLHIYDSMRLFDLFRRADENGMDLARYLSGGMQALIRYDSDQKLELLCTLRSWLSHNRSLSKTAAELHIHRNTVTHRIGRAFELLGAGQESGRDLMRISSELQLLEYIDRRRYFGDQEDYT